MFISPGGSSLKTQRKTILKLRKHLLGKAGRTGTRATLLLVTLGLTASVVASPPAPKTATSSLKPAAKHHSWFEIGRASWYGRKFQGRRTASGELFNMNDLTCAHRTLPLGTWIRVTNLHNKKTVLLRVNDRGPVPQQRIVDLSYAAAQKLGIHGIGSVKIEKVSNTDHQVLSQIAEEAPASTTEIATLR